MTTKKQCYHKKTEEETIGKYLITKCSTCGKKLKSVNASHGTGESTKETQK